MGFVLHIARKWPLFWSKLNTMNHLFTVDNTENPLIGKSDFVTFYPSVNRELPMRDVVPFIKNATRNYLIYVIGKAMYDAIYTDRASTDEIKAEVVELAKQAIAWFTVFMALPHLNIVIASSGVKQSSGEGTQNVSQWSFKQARWSALINGEKALEQLLNYMEKNKAETWFNPWTSSAEYGLTVSDYFKKVTDFATLINKSESWRLFKALMPEIRKAEGVVKKSVGKRTYDDLLAKQTSGTDKEKELIRMIKIWIAYEAFQRSIPSLRLYIDGNGIYNMQSTDGVEPGYGVFATANETAVDQLRQQMKADAAELWRDLQNYMLVYTDSFPMWKEDIYQESQPRGLIYSPDQIGGIMI